MANSFYNDENTIPSSGTARSLPVKTEYSKIDTGFELVEEQLDRRVKLPSGAGNEILEDASARALKALGFDADGDIALLSSIGTWKSTWTATTLYSKQDIVKDPSAPYSLYIATEAHTSGASFDSSEKSDHWEVVVDLTELARAEELAFNFDIKTSAFNAVSGEDYAIDSSTAYAATLPASPSANDHMRFVHIDGDCANFSIARNGKKIMGLDEDLTFSSTGDADSTNFAFALVFLNDTYGWRIYPV